MNKASLMSCLAGYLLCLALGGSSVTIAAAALPPQSRGTVYCASDDMRRHYCSVDTRYGVELVTRRSDSPCDFGRTWGYDRRGIWVDRGCRADFQIGGTGGGGWQPGGGGWQPGGGGTAVITCSSDDMRRRECQADTRGGVRLVRQRSDSDCVYGRTWGYTRNMIWVDRGCRADFEVGRIY